MPDKEHISLIGAGLAGPVMAKYLSDHGYRVDIFERRPDMRVVEQSAGRSINLALSARGIEALRSIGIFSKIQSQLLPMKGRMIHDMDGKTHLQSYGQREDEVIYSVSRAHLNMSLMDHIEESGNVKIHFEHDLENIDLDNSELIFKNNKRVSFNRVMGSDGSSSCIRNCINERSSINFQKKPLGHGYKELTIPATDDGQFKIDPEALHIWPRGEFMLIALPNMDRSFTCTLFFPMDGKTSFSSITSNDQIFDLFNSYFSDTLNLIPDLVEEYQQNPVGSLSTVYCDRWNYKDKLVIFGDAAHAIVPFFGQGMNASFQDCTVIHNLIEELYGDWRMIFSEFSKNHVPNGHAIANMALENYLEMRDSVNDPAYKIKRELEFSLENKFRDRFIPRYSMVSFHTIPYTEVYKRGLIQLKMMEEYLSGEVTQSTLYENILNQLAPIK